MVEAAGIPPFCYVTAPMPYHNEVIGADASHTVGANGGPSSSGQFQWSSSEQGATFAPNPSEGAALPAPAVGCSTTSQFSASTTGDYQIQVKFRGSEEDPWTDTSAGGRIRVIKSDLVADGVGEEQEEDPGLFLVAHGPRHRLQLGISFPGAIEYMKVTLWTAHAVEIWSAEEAGDLLYDPAAMQEPFISWDNIPPDSPIGNGQNNWDDFPSEVWVQPLEPSAGVSSLPLELQFEGWCEMVDGSGVYTGGGDTDTVMLTVVGLSILQDGQDITNTTHDEIVGKRINLHGQFAPAETPVASQHWTIPGSAIADFHVGQGDEQNGPQTPGEVVPLEDFAQDSIQFYWHDGADGREVRYAITVEGQELECKAAFNVKRPTATMGTQTGEIAVTDAGDPPYLALRFGDPAEDPEDGIVFNCTVQPPEGFEGTSCFLQKFNEYKRLRSESMGHPWQRLQGAGLDNVFPFKNVQFPTVLQENPKTEDSPRVQLTTGSDRAEALESGTMWLMFRPDGANSIWVPLQKVWWYWRASATKVNGQWELDEGSDHSIDPVGHDTTEYPTWTYNIVKNEWEWE